MAYVAVFILLFASHAQAFISSRSLTLLSLPRCLRVPLNSIQTDSDMDDVQIYPINVLPQMGGNSSQSLVPDIAYYYLQKTIGLSEETMWKITLEAGSVLGMTPRNLEKKVSVLRRTMDLSDEDIREMLGKQPALLHYSADRNLAPTILLLVRALDLSKSELRSLIMACPSILGYSMDNLKNKLSFFMNKLGYNSDENGKEKLRELFLQEPKLLTCGVKSGLEPRMKFLHREIQFTLKDLRSLYLKNPRLLLYSLDGNLREKIVFFFILQLQMEPEDVRKMLMSYPNVMDYSLDHMKPIAEYFVSELEFSAMEFGSIILRCPRLFTHSLFKVKHVIGFLRYELALNPQQVKRVIFQAPQIIGLDTEGNLKEKLNFLQRRIDLTQKELTMCIAKMPTIFSLNVETSLIPKLKYLESCFETKRELKHTLLKQPVLLGYSLKRIQSRMERLIKAGISPHKITVGISQSDDNFEKWLASSQSRFEMSQWNSTAVTYLCNSLGFTDKDIDAICGKLPYFPTATAIQIKSQMSFLESVLGSEDLKHIILKYPALIDVRRQARKRLNSLSAAGLPWLENIESLSWEKNEFDSWIREQTSDIKFITDRIKLNSTEAQTILTIYPELKVTHDRKGLRETVELLVAHFNDSKEVKMLLMNHTEILDLHPSRVQSRLETLHLVNISSAKAAGNVLVMTSSDFQDWWPGIEFIREYGSQPSEIESILSMSPASINKFLLQLYLCESTGLKREEAEKVIGAAFTKRLSLTESVQKIVYLLREAFGNSTDDLKQALLVYPMMLRKSLSNTIVPRVKTMQYLKSIGAEYTPNEVGLLLSQSPVKYQQSMVPTMETWGGPPFELDDDFSEDDIRAALQEYSPSLMFAYSQDFNRGDAKIVHWR
jgi:mTERF domain-containing protein